MKWISIFLTNFFVLILLLGVFEIVLRFTGGSYSHFRKGSISHFHYGDIPVVKYLSHEFEEPDYIRIDTQRIPFRKPSGEIRILFLGDSGTFGTHVDRKESFANLIREKLRDKFGETVKVINAGVPGMTTINEFFLLKERLIRLQPDIVVLGIFMANDINFNLKYEAAFYNEDSGQGLMDELFDNIRPNSALVDFVQLRWALLRYKYFHKDLYPFNYAEGEVATYQIPLSEEMDHAFKLMENVLSRIDQLSKSNKINFLSVLIPTRLTVTGNAQEPVKGVVGRTRGKLDFEQPTRIILDVCQKKKIPCLDPIDLVKPFGEAAFIPNDDHLSSLGHQAVAEALVSKLEDLAKMRLNKLAEQKRE